MIRPEDYSDIKEMVRQDKNNNCLPTEVRKYAEKVYTAMEKLEAWREDQEVREFFKMFPSKTEK